MSSNLKLLTEWAPFEYTADMIQESKDNNNGKILMKGVLQKAETLNQNGRIYPRDILEREIRNYQKFIQENRALGECDHPDSSVVNLQNASHNVLDMNWKGNDLVGTAFSEEVYRAAGKPTNSSLLDLVNLVKEIKREPVQRDTFFNIIKTF